MERRLLEYYNRELQHVRDLGGEFARAYPKVAARLTLDEFECADPYVERLLEGFAFLAARIQLKLDAEFPRFTQHLLECVVPGYLAPLPSMAVVQFEPDPGEGSLASGVVVPRHSSLRASLSQGDQTPCEYRTAHELRLWPLEIVEAEYFRFGGAASALDLPSLPDARALKAALRIRLRVGGGLKLSELPLDSLPIFLRGADERALRLYEQLLANARTVVARSAKSPSSWHEVMDGDALRRVGFAEDDAMLPAGARGFSGYGLLREYFALPARFLFVDFTGLRPAVRRCNETEMDLVVLFDRLDTTLEGGVTGSDFALHCTPAVNLFARRAERITLNDRDPEHLVLPDRTRPLDFEVVEVRSVEGYGTGGERVRQFLPFYSTFDVQRREEQMAYFSTRRVQRLLSERETRTGARSSYLGSDVFLSLVDAQEAPYRSDLRELGLQVLCTNRDLPFDMPVGVGRTDFTSLSGAPVRAVRCVAGPTPPRPSLAEGELTWRVISHLSLNHLSLTDLDERQGAASLREMLALYAHLGDAAVARHVEALRSVKTTPTLQPLVRGAQLNYVRGLEVEVTFDENALHGAGAFLLGTVLEQFFARYVSVNSFTETVIRTLERGEIKRWPARIGSRAIL
ncbi:MAG TPA: type VI secretion system baseplate subunit TssF [Polyangiaceae bacterium]|nr:type VI secretion system baseplate subunit TssF [Polyangiaceae bacterium]